MSQNSQTLPKAFRRIHLELAREPGHPLGAKDVSYTFVAPLDQNDHLDADLWHAHRDACRVVRHKPNAASVTGLLRRRPGGSWAFHYEIGGKEDDDPGYRLDKHRMTVGEYVTVLEDDGEHVYRVASVEKF